MSGNNLIRSGVVMLVAPIIVSFFVGLVYILGSVNWTPKFLLTLVIVAYLATAVSLIGIGLFLKYKDDKEKQ